MTLEATVYSVSELNACVKDLFDNDVRFRRVFVRGELSNYKIYPSGHHYFTLKDGTGALKCVMFRGNAMRLRFRPQDGMQVICGGQLTVYERDGVYQLVCAQIIPEGAGDLYLAFEQLKKKLLAEGLFDPAHKKPIPKYPHRVVVITSSAGAAIRDILRIFGARYPLAEIRILPVRVQGAEAPGEICEAIAYANRHQLGDVILTGRGGGSIEDLWAFNDERVARAIYASDIPVVSAVGHEPDVTISDFVADLRAATPSNGAELIAPDQKELRRALGTMLGRLRASTDRRLRAERKRLELLASARVLQSPRNILADRRLRLDALQQKLIYALRTQLENDRRRFVRLTAGLDAMSPLKVLSRGYSVVRKPDGALVASVADAKIGDNIKIQLKDGTICAVVDNTERGAI
ncbi:MAG: exodeoxyribonuclease VII large subunit [Oscillospiraceae bacterium]|nr:exodeoxyribonuclease VII large subunit [Oscillospiraceae bacterium]